MIALSDWIICCPACKYPLPDWYSSVESAAKALELHKSECNQLQAFCQFLNNIAQQ